MPENKSLQNRLAESIKLLKDRKSRKAFLYKMSAVMPLFFFIGVGIWLYGIVNASSFPDEDTDRVYATYYKGKNLYITKTQYYSIMVLPVAGLLIYGLANILTHPKIGLFKFEEEENE